MRRRILLLALSATGLAAPAAASAATPLPNSIAAIGDSITRAAGVCCWYGDHPAQSRGAPVVPSDRITSHYEHILALKPSIYGHNYNDAKDAAKMPDAAGQPQTAVTQGARCVTILIGGNDLCTSSPATMTSIADFQTQFAAAMGVLASGLPANSHVFVSSIPDVYQLWLLFHTNLTAELVWSAARICQSLLSPYNTDADSRGVSIGL